MAMATFTVDGGSGILRDATGHALTINVEPDLDSRVVLLVSEVDYAKVGRGFTGVVEVTDLMTGLAHRLVAADCGLGCRCAATFAR